MSEFSESYHLKNGSIEEAIHLIKQTSQAGYVGKLCDTWVTLVPESAMCGYRYDQSLIGYNRGIILHYVFPEDHGFMFRLFQENRLICEYAVDINGGDFAAEKDLRAFNGAAFLELTGTALSAAELETLLQPKTWEEYSALPGKLMASLGIPGKAYEWLSYHYCECNKEDNPEVSKNFVKIIEANAP